MKNLSAEEITNIYAETIKEAKRRFDEAMFSLRSIDYTIGTNVRYMDKSDWVQAVVVDHSLSYPSTIIVKRKDDGTLVRVDLIDVKKSVETKNDL
jgi:hypothetical protein